MDDICRICTRKDKLKSIFQEKNTAENIMLCASVRVTKGDGLPQYICESCLEDLNTSIKFKKNCERTDRALKLYLNLKQNGYSEGEDDNSKVSITTVLVNSSSAAKLPTNEDSISNKNTLSVIPDYLSPESDATNSTKQELLDNNTKSDTVDVNASIPYGTKEKYFSCNYCTQKFSSKNLLDEHIPNKHSKNSHRCEFCNRTFVSKIYLKSHRMVKHNMKEEKKLLARCDICGKIFKYRSKLTRHVQSHITPKQFECKQCQKRFATKTSLVRHSLKHNNIKSHRCKYCMKNFANQNDLQMHMTMHADNKFQCKACNKDFMTKPALIMHRRIHLKEMKFSCMKCKEVFTDKHNLVKHLRVHESQHLVMALSENLSDELKSEPCTDNLDKAKSETYNHSEIEEK